MSSRCIGGDRSSAAPIVGRVCVFLLMITFIAGSSVAEPVVRFSSGRIGSAVISVAEDSEAQANAIFAKLRKGMTAAQTWALGLRSSCNAPGKPMSDRWTACSDLTVFGHHYVEFLDGKLTDWH